jgi:beta-lactamase superfamily II metal-dependent hydrolase
MSLLITALPANHGDCFVFEETEDKHTLVVDCGLKITFNNYLSKKLTSADSLILTHIDEDHILGAIPMIQKHPQGFHIGKIYFNSANLLKYKNSSGDISVAQAEKVDQLIDYKAINLEGLVAGQNLELTKDLHLMIISPTSKELDRLNESKFETTDENKTDISINNAPKTVSELACLGDAFLNIHSDVVNASSIAFILSYKTKKLLYLADAHPEVLADVLESMGYSDLNKLSVDITKLSHHGSYKNISERLINLISCNTFWISTNGGKSRAKHPDPATLAKLAAHIERNNQKELFFWFNYPIETIECRNGPLMSEGDKKSFNVHFEEKNEVSWL